MENTSFIYLVKRYWWVLLLGAALGGAAANYAASKMAPTYEAKVSLLSGPINASYDGQRAAGNLGRTYAGLASSGPVLERAIATTHARTTVDALRKNVTAISNDVTRIVDVRVRAGGREMSANLANAVARQLISLGGANNTSAVDTFMTTPSIAALDAPHQDEVRAAAERLFGSAGPGRLRIVDPALVPSSPISPRVSLITLMGLFAGLLAAALATVVRAATARGIESEDALVEGADLRILGAIPGGRFRRSLLLGDSKDSRLAADYRVIAAKIGLSASDSPIRSVLVVGASEKDGSYAVAANIAAALAGMQRRVTLLDTGEANSSLTKRLRLVGRPGYADLLNGAGDVDLASIRIDQSPGLDVVPRGTRTDHLSIEVHTAEALLSRLQADVEMIVVSAPPADRESSTLVWGRVADATVVVVTRRKTEPGRISSTLRSLALADANVVGLVFQR